MDDSKRAQRDIDDWLRRQPGTMMGDLAREHDKMFLPKRLPMSGDAPTARRPQGPGEPWFPGVDAWFERNLPLPFRRKLALVLGALGAILGIGIADGAGASVGLGAGVGAFAGLLLIPLLIFAVKLTLFAVLLGIAALVGYGLYLAVVSA